MWDEAGVLHQKDTLLPAGTNQINLPKSYAKYSFQMRKWGLTADLLLLKGGVDESTVYTMGGNKEAKKLKMATEYVFVNGAFELDRKKLFDYDEQGRLKEVKYYARSPYNPQLKHTSTDVFSYTGNKLKVYHVDVQNGSSEDNNYTAYTFDVQGKRTGSEYRYLTEYMIYKNIYSDQGVTLYALDANKNRTDAEVHLQFTGGNRVAVKWVSAVAVSIEHYTYDFNINPYAHMKYHDMFFENASKNNLLQTFSIVNGVEKVAGTVQNSYDSDGYLSVANQGSSKTVLTY